MSAPGSGYAIGNPALYYYTPSLWGTGMAFNTSTLFLLIGVIILWEGWDLRLKEMRRWRKTRG